MKVIYFESALAMYVVQGDSPYPVVLAGYDTFENDAYEANDAVQSALYSLAPDHYAVVKIGEFTYVAKREGVTILLAQVLRFDAHGHGDRYLAEALDAIIKYEEASE